VRQLATDGLELEAGVTFLVGENGSGKSTIVEGVAMAYGFNAEGGSRSARHITRGSESPLHATLEIVRSAGSPRWGFFLRAETMHGFYTYLEENPGRAGDPAFHEMSHGESFLEVLSRRFDAPGFYCLDEPESALSFTGSLALVGLLHELGAAGSQVLCATHSPLLTALPGSTVYELGTHGFARRAWEDLAITVSWQAYLEDPARYLRHVLASDGRTES